MSKPEKRYFKVYLSRQTGPDDSNHAILFDAIDKQDVYDEVKLLRKFNGLALTHRFSITKNRLYNAILRSLDAYHIATDEEARLNRQIHCARILFNKALYDQSLRLLESARKMATRMELTHVLANISNLEKRILERNQFEAENGASAIEEVRERDLKITYDLTAINELWSVKSRLFLFLYRQGKVRSREEEKEFESLLEEQLNRYQPSSETHSEVAYLVHHIRSAFAFGIGDYETCYAHLSENLSLIRSNPDYFSQDLATELAVLTNAIYVGMRLRKWKESFRMMDDLRNLREAALESGSDDFRVRLFASGIGTELTLYAQSGDFDRGTALAREVAKGLEEFGAVLSSVKKAHLCFNLAVCFLGTGNYHEARKWIHRLLNDTPIDLTRDLYCMAQLLALIIQHELGENGSLPYSLRSARRFLGTRRKMFRTEEVLLNFISDSLRKRRQMSTEERYALLACELDALRLDPFERNAFEFFDFYAWAAGKATGKSFRDVIAA